MSGEGQPSTQHAKQLRPHQIIRSSTIRDSPPARALSLQFLSDSHPAEASRQHSLKLPLAVGRECQAGEDVAFSQLRKISQYLRISHPRRKVLQHINHRDPRATNARLSTALPRLHRDDLRIVHKRTVSQTMLVVKPFSGAHANA